MSTPRKDGPKPGRAWRGRRRAATARDSDAAQRMVPVVGVGRFGGRGYCDRCGQKVAACECEEKTL